MAEPACLIEMDGRDVTALMRDRLLSITVTDNDGEQADEVEIELDDRGYAVPEPPRGAIMTVALGYVGAPLWPVGRFTVDEAWPEGPPDRLLVKGKAADMRQGLKAARRRAWRDTTVGGIVEAIAAEHGLDPAVAPDLAARPVAHLDQAGESDLHFLTRLGRDHGATAAPKGGALVFAPGASGLSATGKALEAITLDRRDLIDWKGVSADREGYGTVRARYRDLGSARTVYATAGGGDPVRTLRNTYADEAAAKAAAEAELSRLGRAAGGVELTLPGLPALMAQTPIILTGLRPSLSRRWIATTVTHRLDWSSGGFVTTVAASLTGKSEGA